MTTSSPDAQSFLAPRYWPAWLAIGSMKVICRLPFHWQLWIGARIGDLAFLFARSRRHIARTNIELCFPDLSASEQLGLVRETFRNNGRGIVETAYAWFGDLNRISHLVDIQGLDHLKQAESKGKGVMLLGMHFSTLDLMGAMLARQAPFDVMYRKNKNPLMEHVMREGRERNFPDAIERSDVRAVIRAIRKGHIVWYGPDQDYGRKHSVFADFFGIPAATITATSRIARMTECPVVHFQHRRLDDHRYLIELSAPLDGFPSDDDELDARYVNERLEQAIRKAPDQYWWVHRRFKTRPAGEQRPY